MYLYRVSREDDFNARYSVIENSIKSDDDGGEDVYWRKYTSLHNWFIDSGYVKHTGDNLYIIPSTTLLSLIITLKEVLEYKDFILEDTENDSVTHETIVARLDEIFYNSDYDKEYFERIEDTLNQFEKLNYKNMILHEDIKCFIYAITI